MAYRTLTSDHSITPVQATFVGLLTATLFLILCFQLRSIFKDVQHLPEEKTITRAAASLHLGYGSRQDQLTYDSNTFPGARHFKTVYGTIQIFEWGPEDGEKVLLIHGLGTPCIALGDMAKEFVRKGHRVMIFDLFGRGYSDAPNDLNYDARLYTSQILLVLSSSPLAWTGTSAFHLVGFSLGGSISASFAAYHSHMLRSLTLVAPGGLIRTSHISRRSRFLYSSGLIPDWLRLQLVRDSLEPRNGAPSADVLEQDQEADIEFDDVPVACNQPRVRIGDVIRWQLSGNPGFVAAYLSTIRSALVYRRHDRIWKLLGDELTRRHAAEAPPGLPGGQICLIVAERDVIVIGKELLEDIRKFLRPEDLNIHVMKGGHEIAIVKGREVATLAMASWHRKY